MACYYMYVFIYCLVFEVYCIVDVNFDFQTEISNMIFFFVNRKQALCGSDV